VGGRRGWRASSYYGGSGASQGSAPHTRRAPPALPTRAADAGTMLRRQAAVHVIILMATRKIAVIILDVFTQPRAVLIYVILRVPRVRVRRVRVRRVRVRQPPTLRRLPPILRRRRRHRCVRRTRAAPPVFPRRETRAATMQPPRPCVRRALTLIPTRRLAIITRAVRTLSTTTTAMTIVGGRAAIYLTRTLVRQKRAVTTLPTTTVDTVIWMLLKCVLLHQRLR